MWNIIAPIVESIWECTPDPQYYKMINALFGIIVSIYIRSEYLKGSEEWDILRRSLLVVYLKIVYLYINKTR